MQLTGLQLQALKRYHKFHRENFHSSILYLAYGKVWFLVVIFCGVSYWLTTRDSSPSIQALGWAGIGYFAAIALNTVKTIRVAGKFWPLLDEIINWERAEEILKENDPQFATHADE